MFLLPAPPAWAQDIEGREIVALQVKSKTGFTTPELGKLTGIRKGIPYSGDTIRQSLDALYATGLFKDVVVEVDLLENGVSVTYNLVGHNKVGKIVIKGNIPYLLDRTLKKALNLQIGEEFTEARWKKAIENLMDFLHRRGYLLAQVKTTTSEIPKTNQVRLLLQLQLGGKTRIRKVRFTGNRGTAVAGLWSKLKLKVSQEVSFDAGLLDRDLVRLEELYRKAGYFQAKIGPAEFVVDEKTNEVDILIPIEAGTRLILEIEDYAPFEKEELAGLLLFGEEKDYDETVFEISADKITRFIRSKGYPLANVSYTRIENPEKNEVHGRFTVKTGPFSCLRAVIFKGNTFFKSEELLRTIQTRQGSLLSCGVLNPETIEGDLLAIRGDYLQGGFQGVQIEPGVEYNREKTLANLIFKIEEGPRTFVSSVEFEGNDALSTKALQKKIRLLPGMPFDSVPLQKDQDEILAEYGRNGYLYSGVTAKVSFSDDRTRASIRYVIQERAQVTFGRVFLQGNTLTKDNVILRELKLHQGNPYNPSAIHDARRRIQNLGIVGNVKLEPVRPIDPNNPEAVKDLRLEVRELPTKAVDFGLGYADEDRLRGSVQIKHRNLWGTGRSGTLKAEGSSREIKYSAIYTEPWALGRDMDGQAEIFSGTLFRDTYEMVSHGGKVGLKKNITAHLRAVIDYQFENNRFREVTPDPEFLEEDQRANVASLNPSLFWDTRDDPFNPTSGFLQTLTFRDAALVLGSQVQFTKATAQSSWFFPMRQWMVLALSARGGVADRFGETKTIPIFGEVELVPLSERFYLGGRSSVRGYAQDELGIVGETIDPATGKQTGGNAMVVFNAEIRFSLPFGMGFALFHDRGNVFRTRKTVDLAELKSTIGAGIWIRTPVGPIRVDYGYKLDREDNLCPLCLEPVQESNSESHFTLGFAF